MIHDPNYVFIDKTGVLNYKINVLVMGKLYTFPYQTITISIIHVIP